MNAIVCICAAGLAAALFGPTLKCLPGMYHVRTLYAVLVRKAFGKPRDHRTLFKPEIFTSRNPLFEVDVYFHKTNSSYFSDLDESRLCLLARVFPECFSFTGNNIRPAMGGTACTFFKAIAPFEKYEVTSQILSWDDKWLYIASYFLVAGGSHRLARAARLDPKAVDDATRKVVIATAITKYCFKLGRLTLEPEQLLQKKKLLIRDSEVEWTRKKAEGAHIAASMDALGALRDGAFLMGGR
ncbi:hypothetical protein B0T10DRAFT_533462 [Thelonectria olida]|uniref:Uncharacterized protein n=1 Tax=Thelonectria olida TaxID=1576542 RepID=A0A9P8VPN2_9HYPO|nr:hypothetical protein B0T10DRAFT_533462 [Thelonectria olida]